MIISVFCKDRPGAGGGGGKGGPQAQESNLGPIRKF